MKTILVLNQKLKDFSGIVSLNVDGTCLTTATEKAKALNKPFFNFFTEEDCRVPTLESNPFPDVDELYFSTFGISCILEKLPSNKAPGPDEIPVYILELCNEEIAPVLQIIFTQSFKDQNLQVTGSWQILCLFLRKAITIWHLTTGLYH